MQCNQCIGGNQHLCGTVESTIVGRHGGFADKVRGHWSWVTLLPTTLAPQGKLHTVGAVLEPMAIPAFSLIMGEKSVGGSPLGSVALTRKMLEFCVRHNIYPTVEEFDMKDINKAIKHLEDGKARFRLVLKA